VARNFDLNERKSNITIASVRRRAARQCNARAAAKSATIAMEIDMSEETIASRDSAQKLIPLLARALLSIPFIWAGCLKILAPSFYLAYFGKLGLPLPMAALGLAIAVEVGGGVALLLGFQTRIAAGILGAWCVATAVVAYTNFSDPNMQFNFMKNVAMAGGFLYVVADRSWRRTA
jgi:putative oxidoreductase